MPLKFKNFLENKEEALDPHVVKANPPMKIPDGIKRLADAFKKSKEVSIGKEIDSAAGGEKDVTLKSKKIYIVGGAVRDYMLGHTPRNYDLATDAHPQEVEAILRQARPAIRITKQDPKKGLTHISVDGEEYELHTLQKKSGNPDEGNVFTTNPGEDCEGRDFTINALYYDVIANSIIDHCGGLRHLKDGEIKPIGKADEKMKDGMTKYRAMRMANTVPNGKFDDATKQALTKSAGEDDDVSPEKVREEFLKGLEHAHSDVRKYIKSYADHGLLQKVFPKLQLNADLPECGTCKNRAIVLAYLLKDNKPAKLVTKLKELKYTDREIKDAVYLINLLWFAPDHVYEFKKELLNTSLTKRQVVDWAKMNKLDKDMIEKLVNYNLRINGGDLAEREGLQGDQLRGRIKSMEADEFKKTLHDD